MRKYKKIISNILFLLCALFLFIYFFYSELQYQAEAVFLDIGQGDASLFKLKDGQIILVDGGPDNILLRRLGEELPFYFKQIDFLIVSHWHDDHFVGLIEVLRRFKVKNLIYAQGLTVSFLANHLLQEAKEMKINTVEIKDRTRINFNSDCFADLFNPLSLNIKEDGNNSLLFKLNCYGQEILLAGDNEKGAEDALLASNFNLRAKIFKASHHGSQTSNQILFLEAIQPELMIISSGLNNKFKHPSLRVLKNAQDLGIKIRRTDFEGNISLPFN